MFKKTSDNTQSREARKVTFSTKSDYGVDPTVFAEGNQKLRDALVGQIKEIEFKLGLIRYQLAEAYREHNHELRRELLNERDRLREQIADLQLQLAAAKVERDGFLKRTKLEEQRQTRYEHRQEREEAFERTFIHMAKKMLAGEVFDRILIATIHQIREEHDMSERGSRRLAEKIADVRIK